jgi:uncharacterized damage-inducible protein DinB
MEFKLEEALSVLERTPETLAALLAGLPDDWVASGGDSAHWSPYDVVGHFIHGERTDWIPRAKIILSARASREFEPFDRFAQFEASQGASLADLLDTFARLRKENLQALRALDLGPADYERTAVHPELGVVTLRQLLATWVVHDLNHIGQIVQALAGRYAGEVGPWREYLGILEI